MSLPLFVSDSGMPTLGILEQNLAIARNFKPMTAAKLSGLSGEELDAEYTNAQVSARETIIGFFLG